jgi:ATP/maltotriose-dependent transcriptional regulator MalT
MPVTLIRTKLQRPLSPGDLIPRRQLLNRLIVNELDELLAAPHGGGSSNPAHNDAHPTRGFILALDDYHAITEPAIHQILPSLIQHLPHGVHLALATGTDPPLPLAGYRARRKMTEVRSVDLRFTCAAILRVENHRQSLRQAGRPGSGARQLWQQS